MEQLRHRLVNASPKGQRCSADQNTLKRNDLDDFVACYNPKNRHERKPTWTEKNDKGRWRSYDYEELIKRDKINLDIFWLKDEALEDSANLPAPEIIAADITEDLQAPSPNSPKLRMI
jgi:type I restriction enzyme M protein